MSEWDDGFRAGWRARDLYGDELLFGQDPLRPAPRSSPHRRAAAMALATRGKGKRKASAYNKRYGAAFKRLAPKYKTKAGKWKKDGFKRCAAAARKAAKK